MPDVRLIDLDLLKGKVEAMQACEPHYAYNFLNDALNPSTEWECIEDMIDSIPVIDAQPIIHAHWIMLDKQVGQCSNCGYCHKSNGIDKTGRGNIHKAVYKWCTVCGAKMDGGDADETP